MVNVAILTSNQPRHKAFVSAISNLISPKLVIVESKQPTAFVDQEKKFFDKRLKMLNLSLDFVRVKKGKINSNRIENLLIENEINVAFVFGTSILKSNIFNIPRICVNVHTGLVQEYRGVDSNFWALYENNIEAIGVTVHKINKGIDTGGVLNQKRINLSVDDSIESIFLKSCEAGIELIEKNINKIVGEELQHIKPQKKGKLFVMKNMNNAALLKVKKTMSQNIRNYLEDKDGRNERVELINAT